MTERKISTSPNALQHPQVALLKQIKGVGTLIALTFLLTLEAHRFRKSRDVGCYLGLQPGEETPVRASRRCISARKGIPICARCWCKGAQHILGPFGVDCALRH